MRRLLSFIHWIFRMKGDIVVDNPLMLRGIEDLPWFHDNVTIVEVRSEARFYIHHYNDWVQI